MEWWQLSNILPPLPPFIVLPHFSSCDAVPLTAAPWPQILNILVYSWPSSCTPVWGYLCFSWSTQVTLSTASVQRPLPLSQTHRYALIELFISGVLYGQEMGVFSFTILRHVRRYGRDLKIWWGVPTWTRWWPAHLMHRTQRRHQQGAVILPLQRQRGQERALTAVMTISPHLRKRARMINQSKV